MTSDHFKAAHIQELVLHDLTILTQQCVLITSRHFKVACIEEHVLPMHDLTMLNSAVCFDNITSL